MEIKEIFKDIFRIDKKLATINLVPGVRVYDEDLIKSGDVEYRTWNPYRSKLAAAIVKGLKNMAISQGSRILYLGAANGTTCSHVSDIIKNEGALYCVEISKRSMQDLLMLCEKRENMLPLLQDARYAEKYAPDVGKVDVIYQDLSAKDQAEILLANNRMLKRGGIAYVAIKSQSINIAKRPEQVYKEFLNRISSEFEILEKIDIDQFDKHHLFVVLKKR